MHSLNFDEQFLLRALSEEKIDKSVQELGYYRFKTIVVYTVFFHIVSINLRTACLLYYFQTVRKYT
jgi:hypothetical protein